MTSFTTLTAVAAPLAEDNVDTDIIVPARFLLITEKKGLGRYAFFERRYDADGSPRPNFVLNDPRYADAKILVAGANFGCGSSREHAPWALADLGFRAIIAPSFGEIFAANCLKNGILAIALNDVAAFLRAARNIQPISIDLIARTVTTGEATSVFVIDDWARDALINGWDEVDTILERHSAEITAFEGRQRAAQPWLWSND